MPLLQKEKVKMGENAIIVDDISKFFRIPLEKKRTVYENLIGLIQRDRGYDEFWALKDVSFTIKRARRSASSGRTVAARARY